jgi:hypothetical protein
LLEWGDGGAGLIEGGVGLTGFEGAAFAGLFAPAGDVGGAGASFDVAGVDGGLGFSGAEVDVGGGDFCG